MTSITNKKSDETPISSYTYGYDAAGQRTWVKRANGNGDVYNYDATDQLTNVLYEAANPDGAYSAWTNEARYAFDAAGNRTSVQLTNTGTTTYIANELNQYTNVGGMEPSWDDNGNLSGTEYDGTSWVYGYDRENRLTGVESLGGVTRFQYRYDASNRLTAWSGTARTTTRFYYDDQWRVIAEYDGNDNLVAKYVYGPEVDEPVRMTRNGTNYFYHAAALGTVTEITLANQTVAERYTYDVYGEPKMWDGSGNPISSSGIGNRLMFQGRDRDPDTGFYNFRNRYYSSTLGRFLQVDPIRQRGGINLYAFVNNNPVLFLDAFGLDGSDGNTTSLDQLLQTLLNSNSWQLFFGQNTQIMTMLTDLLAGNISTGYNSAAAYLIYPHAANNSHNIRPGDLWSPTSQPFPWQQSWISGYIPWTRQNFGVFYPALDAGMGATPIGLNLSVQPGVVASYNFGNNTWSVKGSGAINYKLSSNVTFSVFGYASGTPSGSGQVNWDVNGSITRKF